jgi:hypothetical protein
MYTNVIMYSIAKVMGCMDNITVKIQGRIYNKMLVIVSVIWTLFFDIATMKLFIILLIEIDHSLCFQKTSCQHGLLKFTKVKLRQDKDIVILTLSYV